MKLTKYLSVLMLFAVLCGVLDANAIPAYPYPINVTQPDGSVVQVIMRGDEFFNYTTTVSGDAVVRKGDGYYYYATYSHNGVEVSNIRMSDPASKTLGSRISAGLGGVSSDVASTLRGRSLMWQDMVQSSMTKSTSKVLIQPKRGVILLLDYKDVKFSTPNAKSAFTNMSNQSGYSANGGTGSVKDYFSTNSSGAYDPTFDVYGPFTLSQNMSYYGGNDASGNDKNPREMIAEGCALANAAGVDFSNYDADGDGVIDMVFVYYAGYSEAEGASSDAIWPHKWSAANLKKSFNGKNLDVYACSNELRGVTGTTMSGIGTFAHEFSHVLGLMDMYDTDGAENGSAQTLGKLSLMSSGSYNNNGCTPPYYSIFERSEVGWATAVPLPLGDVTLEPIHKNKGYMMASSALGEYFMFEVRDNTGWDKYMLGNEPVKGMIIYHVDRSSNKTIAGKTIKDIWAQNKPNAYSVHPCMKVIPAVGTYREITSGAFFPGSGKVTKIIPGSHNLAKDWTGEPFIYDFNNIVQSGNNVTFNVSSHKDYFQISGKVINNEGVTVSGATVKLSLVQAMNTKSTQKLLKKSFYKIDNSTDVIVTSDIKGEFKFGGLDDGKYNLSIAYYGYAPVVDVVEVTGNVDKTYTIQKQVQPLQKLISHSGNYEYYLQTTSSVGIANKFSVPQLSEKGLVGKVVNAVYFYTANPNIQARVYIKVDGQEIYSWNVVTATGLNVAGLPSAYTVAPDKVVEVGVIYGTGGVSIFVDGGPAVVGYGDLISIGGQWSTLSREGFDVNTCVGFWVDKGSLEVGVPDVTVKTLGQRDIEVAFGTEDANIDKWEVSFGKVGLENTTSLPAIANLIAYKDLDPNTKYTLTVTSVVNGAKKSKTIDLTTTDLTAPYVAIALPNVIPFKQTFAPRLTNMPASAKSVIWRLDGEIIENIVINTYGTHTLSAEIIWLDNSKELVTRKFNVAE